MSTLVKLEHSLKAVSPTFVTSDVLTLVRPVHDSKAETPTVTIDDIWTLVRPEQPLKALLARTVMAGSMTMSP